MGRFYNVVGILRQCLRGNRPQSRHQSFLSVVRLDRQLWNAFSPHVTPTWKLEGNSSLRSLRNGPRRRLT